MSNKVALITGVTGQDGSYLAGAAARKGLYRSSYKAPFILVQHGAHRSSGNDGFGTGEAAGDPGPCEILDTSDVG